MTDFYNFTFNSLGSIGAILLLNLFSIPHIEKSSVFFLNISYTDEKNKQKIK